MQSQPSAPVSPQPLRYKPLFYLILVLMGTMSVIHFLCWILFTFFLDILDDGGSTRHNSVVLFLLEIGGSVGWPSLALLTVNLLKPWKAIPTFLKVGCYIGAATNLALVLFLIEQSRWNTPLWYPVWLLSPIGFLSLLTYKTKYLNDPAT